MRKLPLGEGMESDSQTVPTPHQYGWEVCGSEGEALPWWSEKGVTSPSGTLNGRRHVGECPLRAKSGRLWLGSSTERAGKDRLRHFGFAHKITASRKTSPPHVAVGEACLPQTENRASAHQSKLTPRPRRSGATA